MFVAAAISSMITRASGSRGLTRESRLTRGFHSPSASTPGHGEADFTGDPMLAGEPPQPADARAQSRLARLSTHFVQEGLSLPSIVLEDPLGERFDGRRASQPARGPGFDRAVACECQSQRIALDEPIRKRLAVD